jgi:hypothetical protein
MTNVDEFFGKHLKAEHIKEETAATVKEVAIEVFGRDDETKKKPVVYFNELDRGLALNQINSEVIAEIAGTKEIEKWPGTKVCLYVDPNIEYRGKRVGGIRVKEAKEKPSGA